MLRRAARQTQRRPFDRDEPARRRWLDRDVDGYLDEVWRRTRALLSGARLGGLPTPL